MSEEKRPEAQGSDQQTTNDSTGGSGTRQQANDARRSSNSAGAGGGNVSGGGGGRHGGPRRRHRGGERENQAPSQGRRTESSINMDELRELADLITAQGFTEFELEKEGFRLRLSRNIYSQPAATGGASDSSGGFTHFANQPPASASHAASAPAAAETSASASTGAAATTTPGVAENVNILTSPIVGTFYRSPSPDAAPYVEVGSRVTRGQVVCIIEAMKLMNEIEAEWDGVITEIFPQNGQAVEFGERLFGIKAS